MNAIILAAGLGSRFQALSKTKHKALLPIGEIPNIERTILYLKESGIHEIYIVTGHLKEQFSYLVSKYQVKLLENPKYREYNSIYSLYQALDYFHNSFVIDSDVVLFENIFTQYPPNGPIDHHPKSVYYTIIRPKSEDQEWCVSLNQNGKVIGIDITNEERPSLLGISFWCEEDCKCIKTHYQNYLKPEILSLSKLYWDNIPIDLLGKLKIQTIPLSLQVAYEMDTITQYKYIQHYLKERERQ